jgi:hypothetical protein
MHMLKHLANTAQAGLRTRVALVVPHFSVPQPAVMLIGRLPGTVLLLLVRVHDLQQGGGTAGRAESVCRPKCSEGGCPAQCCSS